MLLNGAVVQAETLYSATVYVRASASNDSGAPAFAESSDFVSQSSKPVSLGLGTGSLFGQREFVQAYDGRCVVIATGAPCVGGEPALSTQTVLDASKPVMAPVSTSASGDVQGYARSGSVGARAASTHTTALGHATIDPANPGRSLPGVLIPTSDSHASASASVRHTNSLSGPAGAVATITLRGSVSSMLDIGPEARVGNVAQANMEVQGSAAPVGLRCNNLAAGCANQFAFSRRADHSGSMPLVLGFLERDFEFSFQGRSGDIVSLYAGVVAISSNSGEADASHTVRIDEIALSEGFYFADESGLVRTANGYAFAAAVPEPGTWALASMGLALIGAAARRRVRA